MFDPALKRKIQISDKYARTKAYLCLVPGCHHKAIKSHAVPRSLLIEAIAEDKHLYTQPASFNRLLKQTEPTDPLDIELTGVNNACAFTGFCSQHDRMLFAPAEAFTRKWHSTQISLHLRAISFEYSRKRLLRDFQAKLLSLMDDSDAREQCEVYARESEVILTAFETIYYRSIMELIAGSPIDTVDYVVIPFARNLKVSCCGLFDSKAGDPSSAICYNLISHAPATVLSLTAFKYSVDHLNDFLFEYNLSTKTKPNSTSPEDLERLVNDIAFFHSEEPLIAPPLWRSLSDEERLAVRCSIRHPRYRVETAGPRIIKIAVSDLLVRRSEAEKPPDRQVLRRLPFSAATRKPGARRQEETP